MSIALGAIIGAGLVLRLVLAATTDGVAFEMGSFRIAYESFLHAPGHLYAFANAENLRWPYPTGFIPVLLVAGQVSDALGGFSFLVRLPSIVGDLAIAWLVQDYLRMRGAGDRVRLISAALVALGPAFVAVSGYHGAIDGFAFAFPVAALWVWERWRNHPRRALGAGALVGLGAAMMTMPFFALLALLPHARDRRETRDLLLGAIGVPLIGLLPFLAVDLRSTLDGILYHGGAGVGGLSLLVQPNLALAWYRGEPHAITAAEQHLQDAGLLIALVAVGVVWVLLRRRRPAPEVGASLVFLAILAFGVNFFLAYVIWLLPFLLMTGRWRATLAVQVVFCIPLTIRYLGTVFNGDHAVWSAGIINGLYTPTMAVLWVASVVGLVAMARRTRLRAQVAL